MPKRINAPSNTSITISIDEKERLEEIARELGYTQTRGAGVGKLGNLSALIRAIANGDLFLTPKTSDTTTLPKTSNEEGATL